MQLLTRRIFCRQSGSLEGHSGHSGSLRSLQLATNRTPLAVPIVKCSQDSLAVGKRRENHHDMHYLMACAKQIEYLGEPFLG